jgi:protein-disulfide isomerase
MPLGRRLAPLIALLAATACNRGEGASAAPADSGAAATAASGADGAALDPRAVRADTARIQGSASAPVWVIEVSDYQCPYCKRWHDETYPALVREYVQTGKARFAYVNMPLEMHRNAGPAAEAALCAGAQGAFWPYHDRLFAAQEALTAAGEPRALFDSLATAQGLDAAAFGRCLDERVMRPVVQGDYERMRQAGVNATPTFFVGQTRLSGAQPIEAFREAIDAALAGGGAPR